MREIKELAVNMAMLSYTPVSYYVDMDLDLMLDYAEIIAEKNSSR